MTMQITVRISDEAAAYVDSLVARGHAPSRAAALDRMVRREQRRERAKQDAVIYARDGEDPELEGVAEAALASFRAGDLD